MLLVLNSDLIKKIHARAVELQKKSLKVAIDEGEHRCSADDEYYRGGADALLDLARELEAEQIKKLE